MDTRQRPCRLCRSISCVKWRWCPPLMSKWLYSLSLLSHSLFLSVSFTHTHTLQWVKQQGQVVNHMSPLDIAHQGSVSDTPILVSWFALCPALHPQKAPMLHVYSWGALWEVKSLTPSCTTVNLVFFVFFSSVNICLGWMRIQWRKGHYTGNEIKRQLYISIQCKGHEGIKRKTIKEKMSNFSDTPVLSVVHVQQI